MEARRHTRRGGWYLGPHGQQIACWKTVMDEDRYLTRRWNEFHLA